MQNDEIDLPRHGKVSYFRMGKWPILLFLHGYGVSPEFYQEFLDILSRRYEIIAPVAFWINNMDEPPISIEEWAEFVELFCNELKISPSLVIGHSLGWAVASAYAGGWSEVSNSVFINPVFPVTFGPVGFFIRGWYKHFRAVTGITGGRRGIAYGTKHFFPFLRNFFSKPICSWRLIRNISNFSWNYESHWLKNNPTKPRTVRRVLFLYGQRDEFFNAESCLAEREREEWIIVKKFERLSHDWPIFYPELAAKEVLDWVGRTH